MDDQSPQELPYSSSLMMQRWEESVPVLITTLIGNSLQVVSLRKEGTRTFTYLLTIEM